MSDQPPPPKAPRVLHSLGYCYGLHLTDSMRRWVADDLSGPGAIRP